MNVYLLSSSSLHPGKFVSVHICLSVCVFYVLNFTIIVRVSWSVCLSLYSFRFLLLHLRLSL